MEKGKNELKKRIRLGEWNDSSRKRENSKPTTESEKRRKRGNGTLHFKTFIKKPQWIENKRVPLINQTSATEMRRRGIERLDSEATSLLNLRAFEGGKCREMVQKK